jgi:SH3 domain protein
VKRRAAWLLAAWLGTPCAVADTAWVSDVFFVPLRSGPSEGNRIIHKGLKSGTALAVVEPNPVGDFTHVRTEDGLDGWIRSQYLVHEPIAAIRLDAANRRIAALEQQLEQRGDTLKELTTTNSAAASSNEQLTAQVAKLEAELAEVKRVSGGAIEEHERNQALNELNTQLRAEVDRVVNESQQLKDNAQQRWLLIGGGLVLGGLLAGVALKSRPRRSGWS